ncbi:hypothetical protein AB0J81_05970 [Streptomyces bobili]|uniref:hypothetical protein n=1 Tax=Streptomyces bobili TaxID=67280 RepID=UPI0033E7952C
MTHGLVTGHTGLTDATGFHHAVDLSRELIQELARTDARARRLAHLLALKRFDAVSSDVDLALDVAELVAGLHVRAARLPSAVGTPRAVETHTAQLAQGLAYASESACDLARQLARVDPRGSTQAVRTARSCDEAAVLLHKFTASLQGCEAVSASLSRQQRVSPSARWLIGSAVRVLPVADRPRYAEEWQSELWDLAAEPRRRHLAHALRVTFRAWSTRRAILDMQQENGGLEW